ncbi:unnamed protein product [Bursaphelenchus okinawaensis]|uniref:Uncharacterized protein n=1 Tax=Bursaphelenchus okinawaensis TaxID=465554 RepID=A0A811KPG2_9BILA|nr:unnamed protein product [Bursaphelenchus okinawaensis]CAG9110101.1 unnamed protein product [Bursaphelenchus okinawaensis]
MGDDLAAFFAKKKSKGTKKKTIRMDDVVQQLESNMKFDKDGGEDDVPSNQDILKTNLNDEDSEWIGYGSKPLNLAGETVGTFNSTEVVDEEVVTDRAERESAVVKKTKTSNIPSKAYKPPQLSAPGQSSACTLKTAEELIGESVEHLFNKFQYVGRKGVAEDECNLLENIVKINHNMIICDGIYKKDGILLKDPNGGDQPAVRVYVHFWRNGFSVDDGHLQSYISADFYYLLHSLSFCNLKKWQKKPKTDLIIKLVSHYDQYFNVPECTTELRQKNSYNQVDLHLERRATEYVKPRPEYFAPSIQKKSNVVIRTHKGHLLQRKFSVTSCRGRPVFHCLICTGMCVTAFRIVHYFP